MKRPEKWVIVRSYRFVSIAAVWLANYRPTDELLLADDWRERKRLARAAESRR